MSDKTEPRKEITAKAADVEAMAGVTALVTAITNAEAEMLREDVDFTPESEAALIAALIFAREYKRVKEELL